MRIVFDVVVFLLAFRGDDVRKSQQSASAPPIQSVMESHDRKYGEDAAYAFHWDELLLAEHHEQMADFRDRRKNWSQKRLEDNGMSIFGASAEPESELFGDKIVRVVKLKERNFFDKFNRGDVLVMTTQEEDELPRECLVVDVGSNWLSVGVGPTWPKGLWEARKVPGGYMIKLDRSVPLSPLQAQRKSLSLVRKGNAGQSVCQLVTLFCRAPLLAARDGASCGEDNVASRHLERMVRNALERVLQTTAFRLNQSQCDAICWALQQDISIIRGPPGTGKTRVAALVVATAIGLNSLSLDNRRRVLAVTHSNGAADVLLEALLQVGVPAVRIGRPASVSAHVQHRTAAALAETHPEVVALRRMAGDMKLPPHERSGAARQMQQCLIDVQKLIVESAPVVVASCIGAHQLLTDDGEEVKFSTVVLDEAAQTTEPALICALAAARAKQVVLVGDTKQLPPTITSIGLRDTLGVSPMARLEALGLPVKTLQVQYRLPTILLEHPSKYFYNGLIQSADTIYQGPPPKGFDWPNNKPLAFVHVGSNLERAHEFGGRSNPTEAGVVLEIATGIMAGGEIAASNMAIVSPYAKQVQLVRAALAARRIDDVRVGTVDSFQGQETDLVIFSSVRSNEMFELGFVRDPRRLCVAITRARRGLILVGDRHVLRACHHWAALISHCSSIGCVIDATSLGMAAAPPPPPPPPPILPPTEEVVATRTLLRGNFTFNDILADLIGDGEDEEDDDDLAWLEEPELSI